jgi:transcriptional regulator with XRE-family HTH domain
VNAAGSNKISPPEIPSEWLDVEYRQEAMEATLFNLIAWQVRVNREERGLTQSELARLMRTKQSAISKLEDPDGGDVQVSTLIKAAHAFDCALILRFVDYQRFADRTANVGPASLFACPFSDLLPAATSSAFQSLPE